MVSLMLAGGLYLAAHKIEERLIDDTLTSELHDFVSRRQRNPASTPPATAAVKGYIRTLGEPPVGIPSKVAELQPGRYELYLGGTLYRVAVTDRDGARYYLLYDQTQFSHVEESFVVALALAVLIMIVVSAIGGLWLAARVISPVTELALRVRHLPPDGGTDALAEHFSEDEVGELARVFDRYLERIQAFIERERSFTEDVSHELRTPLTVINGATEVLLRDVSLVGRARQRVQRVARAGRGMSDLTEALLVLAREKTDSARPASECSVEEVLNDTVESHRYLLAGKPVEVTFDIRARPTLMVDRAVLGIVLGNLIRNACTYTESGEIHIELDADRVTVRDTGIGIPGGELGQVFERHYRGSTSKGSGIGLSLVKRICERYGWSITIQSEEGKGATAQLILGATKSGRQASVPSPSDTVSAAQS